MSKWVTVLEDLDMVIQMDLIWLLTDRLPLLLNKNLNRSEECAMPGI